MPTSETDWYPTTRQGERDLYANILAKIEGYQDKYAFLTDPYVAGINTMCATFVNCYDVSEQNRATARQMTTWFANIVDSKQKNEPVPPAPVFLAFPPLGTATVGLERQCRDFAGLMKQQPEYEVAIGWKKAGFDMLEAQYRKAGTEMWQPADKSNVSPIIFTPTLTTPGVPEKFEFRGVYIVKNERVGQWSDIVTQTVG